MGRGPSKPGTSGNRFTDRRKEIYFAELRRKGVKSAARLAANVSEGCVRGHKERYPEFAEAEADAMAAHNIALEDEARRRAVEGVARPITVAGEREVVRDYSDALLVRMLKRFIPDYRDSIKVDQKTEHSGMLSLEADLRKITPRGQDLLLDLVENEILDDGVSEEEAEAE